MDNPYESPSTSFVQASVSNAAVSAAVIEPLAATKGWVRFLAVLGFIGCGLMILAGIGMFVAGAALSSAAVKSGGNAVPAGVGFVYLVMAVLYFVPTLKLNSYASKIGALLAHPSEASLIAALEAQRSFWKVVGIFAIVTIVVYIVFIGIMVVIGMSGAMSI